MVHAVPPVCKLTERPRDSQADERSGRCSIARTAEIRLLLSPGLSERLPRWSADERSSP
jgi:hypothetical protein